MRMNVQELRVLFDLNIDELMSIKTLLDDRKFNLYHLKTLKKKIKRGKVHKLFFNDLYFDIAENCCCYSLKEMVNFLIDNYLDIEKIKQIVLRLEELKIDIIEIDYSPNYTQNYEINYRNQKVFTDGVINYGSYIRSDVYTEIIENPSYIIFMFLDDCSMNKIIIKDLEQTLDNMPTIKQLESYEPDLKEIEKNTIYSNEISSLNGIKQEIISLEKEILTILKKSRLMDKNEKEELNTKLAGLYSLLKEIKKLETSLIGRVIDDNENNKLLVESINQKKKVKDGKRQV